MYASSMKKYYVLSVVPREMYCMGVFSKSQYVHTGVWVNAEVLGSRTM